MIMDFVCLATMKILCMCFTICMPIIEINYA